MRRASSEPPLTTPRLPTPAHPLRPSPSCSTQRFRKAKEKTVQETAICDAICVAKAEVVRLRGPLTSAVEASQEADGAAPELSAFEMQRLENMKQNQAVLQRLGLGGSGLPAAAAGESAPPRCVYSSTTRARCGAYVSVYCVFAIARCVYTSFLWSVFVYCVYTQSTSWCLLPPALCIHKASFVYIEMLCVYTRCV